jgi:hypothetical protein
MTSCPIKTRQPILGGDVDRITLTFAPVAYLDLYHRVRLNLGRPDVLPIHDLGVRRGFQIAYGKRKMPDPGQLARHGKRWAPFRSAAALYLWRAADGPGGGKW